MGVVFKVNALKSTLRIGHRQPEVDTTLIRNLAKAHKWLNVIRAGTVFEDNAKQEVLSMRCVQQVTAFAFLAPDIVEMILQGHWPRKLISKWLLRNRLPDI